MTLSIRSTGYYPAPTRPAAPPAPAAEAPVVVTPMPTVVRNDVLGNSVQHVKDVVKAAMSGSELPAGGLKARALGWIRQGQAAVSSAVQSLVPASLKPEATVNSAQQAEPVLTPAQKAKKVAKAAVFFALPVAGAAGVAAGLGWLVGPLVPFVGGHVFGAVAGALAVGHTTGFLLHGSMRLPLVTDPKDRDFNSAGAAVGSAAIGAGLAAAIAAGAGATVGLPVLALGAAIGAGPRLVEWAIAKI